jgi:chlorosome envelope protein B
MSNGTNDVSGAVSTFIDLLGKLAQQQVEILSNGIKAAAQLVEPLGKTTTDLVGNVFGAINQVLQGVSSSIAPKK